MNEKNAPLIARIREFVPPTAAAVGSVLGLLIGKPVAAIGAALATSYVAAGALRSSAKGSAKRTWLLGQEFRRVVAESPDMAALVKDSDPTYQETWAQILLSVILAVDDRAVRPLARLCSEYLSKPRDAFFVGAAGFLRELNAAEFGAALAILDGCMQAPENAVALKVAVRGEHSPTDLVVAFSWWIPGSNDEQFAAELSPADEHAQTVVLSLKRHRLATDLAAGFAGTASTPGSMRVGRSTAVRLLGLFR